MKKTAKVLLVVLCALLLVVGSVLGTLAWLTSQDTAENTFSVGQVHIRLDETKVTEDGKPVENADRVKANKFHLYPGHTYTKDPMVTLEEGTDSCYVRMIVTVTLDNALSDEAMATQLDNIFLDYDETKWPRDSKVVAADGKTITYEYRYYTTVDAEAGEKALEPLFTKIAVPATYNNAELAALAGLKIKVVAHAIQKDGFSDADAAWAAFGTQHAPANP